MTTNKKICILTSVHPVFDTRIFYKEAKTLAEAGYDVTLIARHDKDETVDGIKIIALPKSKNRIWRILTGWKLLKLKVFLVNKKSRSCFGSCFVLIA